MLILAKSVLSLMIGFLATLFLGVVIVPILRKKHIGQRVSVYLEDSHKKKDGTPTMGGIIFILGTFISILTLLLLDKMEFTPNLFIVLFVFVSYALIGLLDDYLSIKRDTNVGLTAMQKLFLQLIVAVVFFFIYMKSFIIGFSISSFILVYKYKGILSSLIYVIPSQLINILIILILGVYTLLFSKYLFKMIFLKDKTVNLGKFFKKYVLVFGICIILCVISSLCEAYLLPSLLKVIIKLFI